VEFPYKDKVIELLRTNNRGLTISGISRRLRISRHTVTVTLAALYGEGLITVRHVGMAKLIYLKDYNDPNLDKIKQMKMEVE